jgi:hypothetical protein
MAPPNPSSAVRQRKTLLSTIASFYLIIQLMIAAPVIRGPRAMHLTYCYKKTFTVYCKRRAQFSLTILFPRRQNVTARCNCRLSADKALSRASNVVAPEAADACHASHSALFPGEFSIFKSALSLNSQYAISSASRVTARRAQWIRVRARRAASRLAPRSSANPQQGAARTEPKPHWEVRITY